MKNMLNVESEIQTLTHNSRKAYWYLCWRLCEGYVFGFFRGEANPNFRLTFENFCIYLAHLFLVPLHCARHCFFRVRLYSGQTVKWSF